MFPMFKTHTDRSLFRSSLGLLTWGTAAMALTAITALPAAAQAEDSAHGRHAKHGRPMAAMALHAADANGDQQVTAEEWQEHVASLDSNGDGIVSQDEMIEARAERAKERAKAAREKDPMSQRLDADGDGQVTTEEMDAVFATLDSDGDGLVTEADVPERSRGHHRRGPRNHRAHMAAKLLSLADTDGDKQLAQSEWLGFLADTDTNADGLLSADEMSTLRPDGAPEPRRERPDVEIAKLESVFEHMDENADGVLSEDEWPQRRERGRRGKGRRGASGPR